MPPPITGPIESAVNRCPMRIPSAANGIEPDQDQHGHLDPVVRAAAARRARARRA